MKGCPERVPWSWAPCSFSRAAPPNNFGRTTTHAQQQNIGCTARSSAAQPYVFGRSATSLRSEYDCSALAAPPPPQRFGRSAAQQPAIVPYSPRQAGVSFTWAAWGERGPRCAEPTALCSADCSRTVRTHAAGNAATPRRRAPSRALAAICNVLGRSGKGRSGMECVPAPRSERRERAEARGEARQGTPQRGLFSAAKQHALSLDKHRLTHTSARRIQISFFFLNLIQNQAPQFSRVPLYSFGKSFSLQSHSEWFVLGVKYVQHLSSQTWPPIFFATGLLFCVHTKAMDQNGYHLLLRLHFLRNIKPIIVFLSNKWNFGVC
jgi:hypothetical protein